MNPGVFGVGTAPNTGLRPLRVTRLPVGSHNFRLLANTKWQRVTLQGAGGGGLTPGNNQQIGGGGGGGGAYRQEILQLAGDTVVPCVVGQGGTPGNPGGYTRFGSLVVRGGLAGSSPTGGNGAALSATPSLGDGGEGGDGSNGSSGLNGSPGAACGFPTSSGNTSLTGLGGNTTGLAGGGGGGGDSVLGLGGPGGGGNNVGAASPGGAPTGKGAGGGGGGASSSGTSGAGAPGGDGELIIEEF